MNIKDINDDIILFPRSLGFSFVLVFAQPQHRKCSIPKLIEGMVRKPIVLSLLYAFEVEPVLTVHNFGIIFV